MKALKLFKAICLFLVMAWTGFGSAQEKQSRTYTETFVVKPDAVVDIDVSHADISFETWDKNEVSVEALVELEGATAEEATRFFDKGAVEILGNSSLVEIRTGGNSPFGLHGFQMPMGVAGPNLEPLFLDLQIPEIPPLPDLPPMPPIPVTEFDYHAYREEGEKYLKEWKQKFDKNFNKEYRKELEAWGKAMEEGAKEWEWQGEKWQEEHEKMREAWQAEREEATEMAREQREKAMEQREKAREQADKNRKDISIIRRDRQEAPVIFYRTGEGEGSGNLKVKKTIKIRMPKSVKLKMNVRHGEVKLAENTRDLHATLSYARLLAATIDGPGTQIMASYSPVTVTHWNLGSLRADFTDKVALNEVKNLKLQANSSHVTIDRIVKSAQIENNLGTVRINGVSDSFDTMDIVLKNGELYFDVPGSAYQFRYNGTASRFSPPSGLRLTRSGNPEQTVYTGYHLDEHSKRAINIDSRYSEVILE